MTLFEQQIMVLITGISDNGSTLLTEIDGQEMNYGRQVLMKYQVIVGEDQFSKDK